MLFLKVFSSFFQNCAAYKFFVCAAMLELRASSLILKMILKPTPEMPEQAHRPGKVVWCSIGSQASSPISEAMTAPNMNIEFEMRNIKLD